MYRSHLSLSRSKRQQLQESPLTTVDLLHNGLRRKVSQTDYKSIYPRMKIATRSQVNTISILKNQYTQQHLYEQVQKMKEENRKVSTENDQLRTSIRRQNKINQLFNKRKDDCPLHAMSLQKLMELKLILQSEELEQQYAECENRLKERTETFKTQKNAINNHNIEQHINFYCVLEQLGLDLQEQRKQKELLLNKTTLTLHKLKVNTRKMKQAAKTKQSELSELQETIEKEKKKLPIKYDVRLNVSDSGLMQRSKPIEETEKQIEYLQKEQGKLEAEIQNQMDGFIKEKLIIFKEIEELNEAREIYNHDNLNNILIW